MPNVEVNEERDPLFDALQDAIDAAIVDYVEAADDPDYHTVIDNLLLNALAVADDSGVCRPLDVAQRLLGWIDFHQREAEEADRATEH